MLLAGQIEYGNITGSPAASDVPAPEARCQRGMRQHPIPANHRTGIGAVMILLLWFYVMGLAILTGGEVNAEIDNAAAMRGVPEAKEKGQKKPSGPKERAA